MKKFQFSLATVLAYKEQRLELLQGEHAVILARVREAERELSNMEDRYRSYNEGYQERASLGMLITEARVFESELRAMEREIELQNRKLAALREAAEQKREEVVEAKKETASIEKLKEKKQEAYRKAVQKDAEQQIDEFVGAAIGGAQQRG